MLFQEEVLICNLGLQFVSDGDSGTCHTRRCRAQLQREEIIPGDSSPSTSFYNIYRLMLTGQSTSTSCSWDAGFREIKSVSFESEGGKGVRKCGLTEGNDCMGLPWFSMVFCARKGWRSMAPHMSIQSDSHSPSLPHLN